MFVIDLEGNEYFWRFDFENVVVYVVWLVFYDY